MITQLRLVLAFFALAFAFGSLGEEKKTRTPEELVAFGRTMLDSGHPEAAIAFLEEAVSMNPSYADAYELLGDAYALSGRNDKAVEAYEKFLALAPHDPRATDVARFVAGHKPAPAGKSG
jgi:Tfp pilus assembly protein PilF